jgi:transposase
MANFLTPSSSPLRYQGFDISKATFDVARWGDQDFLRMTLSQFPRSPEGVRDWLASVTSEELEHTGLVMESTGGYCKELVGWLKQSQPGLHVAIANPFIVKSYGRSLALRNKTDRMDARLLARFGQDRQPPAWTPLPVAQEHLRSLVRTRAYLMHQLVGTRNRVREHECPSPLAMQSQKALCEALTLLVETLTNGIENLFRKDETLRHWMSLLTSVPGIGLITAATMLGEAGDLRRFNRRGQLVAFLGVSPRIYASGSSVHGRTRMCRMGGAHARAALYMAAVAASRTQGPIGAFYRHLVENGKPKKSALGALMRKLVVVMRAVLIQDRPYEVKSRPSA